MPLAHSQLPDPSTAVEVNTLAKCQTIGFIYTRAAVGVYPAPPMSIKRGCPRLRISVLELLFLFEQQHVV